MPTLEPTTEEARIYEICVLYPHPLNQKEEKEAEQILDEAGSKQIAKDAWGRRGLAYKIKGHMEGSYVIYYYEIDPLKLKEIDEALRILPGVLRHMIVKPPKGYEIVKFSDKYKKWLEERESVDEVKERKKEEALKKQVTEKAKRQVKRAEDTKKEEVETKKEKMSAVDLSKQLEKIISDEDLDI